MGHCTETRKRLNDTAAVEQAARSGKPVGYWPEVVLPVTLDDFGRIVWPGQPAAALAAVADDYDLPDSEYDHPHGPRCAQRFHSAAECTCGKADFLHDAKDTDQPGE